MHLTGFFVFWVVYNLLLTLLFLYRALRAHVTCKRLRSTRPDTLVHYGIASFYISVFYGLIKKKKKKKKKLQPLFWYSVSFYSQILCF